MNELRRYTRRNLSRTGLSLVFGSASATTWIILANIIFFLLVKILILFNPSFFDYIALKPADFVSGKNLWTVFTSMFMHAGIVHLLFNMFSLYFIGKFSERIIGKRRFFVFYLISGLFAGLLFAVLSGYFGIVPFWDKILGNPQVPGVGASGAIFGLLGILALLTPKAKVYLIVGPLIALIFQVLIGQINLPSSLVMVISFIVNIYFIVSILAIFSFNSKWSKYALPLEISFWMIPLIAILPLIIIGFFVNLPIGNIAHFGGFIAGAFYGVYLRFKYPKKVSLLNRHIVR